MSRKKEKKTDLKFGLNFGCAITWPPITAGHAPIEEMPRICARGEVHLQFETAMIRGSKNTKRGGASTARRFYGFGFSNFGILQVLSGRPYGLSSLRSSYRRRNQRSLEPCQ